MKAYSIVGRDIPRRDARSKATGSAVYTDDIKLPGMLHGRILRSPVPHARILNIDVSRAAALPGVKCVITGQDTPKIKYGNWRLFPATQDEYPLAVDKVRFVGDEVAAVAAVDRDTAEEALSLIRVDYEELPAVYDVRRAIRKDAPLIHEGSPGNVSVERKIAYGDVRAGFREADYVREDTFTVHPVSHAYLEPCSTVARCDPDGRITLWTSTQTPYIVQCLLASVLGMRENDIRVIKPFVGGGFGGKMELRPWEFCAAFMAKKTGRPVKFVLEREEELVFGRRRHPMRITSKVGFKKDGTLVAKDLKILLDGGAYNAMGPTATFLCGNFGAMLYRYPNYRFYGRHVYTNKPPASAMRGFGAPQSLFAAESQMNMAAEDLGIDPIELRLKNAQVPGDVIPDVATISSCGFVECLREVARMSGWNRKRKTHKPGRGIGVGCYSFISGGVFNWFNTQYPFSAAEVRAFSDGTVHLLTMASDIGQGSDTALAQILAEELGLRMEDIRVTSADTAMTPQADLGSWGSRVTLMAGNAVVQAARQIKEALFGAVSARFNLNVIYDFECKEGRVQARGRPDRGVSFGEAVAMAQKANRGEPVVARGYYTPRNKGLVTPAFSFGAQVAEVSVDRETGLVEVEKIWTAHDCGTVINPTAVEGQLEGSIHMGLGYALSEELRMENGRTLNRTFLDYKMPHAPDMPANESLCVDTYEPEGPMGAKEAGEGLVSPTAPAIAEAVYHATGYRCKDLPITPEKILKGMKK
ncbi:MAG: molybdopterin-dependent oxidoreductase [Deltaproteobacteria bacterium]|nr:molybdopterin-dependent oxidoreductase [Deltaproteobacteria bacterium]MBW1923611.1 molybdopterin-dependent oxidoreductase [Deltaproteobacteria bacterium]MBW1948702.1 molybdopterin-dependent oxidoreductase [Deltaproteobacteria bacterium]MBW2006871.1 molybdopterin-dependent oxidoreductase [Deltaproteobacteria bacterium]MBW2101126.1 molybdopterin-dependent oxidoreductase [Deltaproteobacteria bacterium]